MDQIARFSDNDRRDLFQETAQRMKVPAGCIEKDFWVCWALEALFTSAKWADMMIFKGGTSLSKVFHLINRFSEDIDLVLDWQRLGVTKNAPWETRSNSHQDRYCRELNAKAAVYIADTFVPVFKQELTQKLQAEINVQAEGEVVIIAYPKTFSLSYVRPEIRLEIGPLAAWVPHGKFQITPYSADHFPTLFKKPSCMVVAILAERTFWEKATILHEQAYAGRITPNYSRHYYDLAQMALTDVKQQALSNHELLKEVVEFKNRFYKSRKARYDLAVPGSFRLLPSQELLTNVKEDYKKMESMIFGTTPTFDAIVGTLKALEDEINSIKLRF